MEQDSDPTRPFWRSRRGWVTAHLLGGIAAAVILFALMLAISLVVLSIPTEQIVALVATLMILAALVAFAPLMAYQSWALRRAVAPWAWCLAWTMAMLSAPLIVAASRPVMVTEGGSHFVFSNAIGGTVLAGLWGAALQWVTIRRRVRFARWMAAAGAGLTLIAMAAGAGLVGGLLIAWTLTMPFALALYAAFTWPSLARFITDS